MKTKNVLTKGLLFLLVLSLSFQISYANESRFNVSEEINNLVNYYQEDVEDLDWEMVLALKRVDEEINITTNDIGLSKESFIDQTPTFYGSRILTLISLGENPYNFEGKNLVNELTQMSDEGVFGSIYDQVYAILGLRASGVEIEREIVDALVDMQLDDGGFGFSSSDPDSASLALMALANYRNLENVSNCIEKTLSYLENVQLETAGFSSYGDENSNSIAKVISALVAVGSDPYDPRWIKNENTIFDALERFKTEQGGYKWTLDEEGENNFYSFKQVLLALTDYENSQTIYDYLKADLEVSLRVEGVNDTIINTTDNIQIDKDGKLTVKEAIKTILDNNEIDYKIDSASFGSYIASINGLDANTYESNDGWLYLVNGDSGMGIDNDIISYGDEIILYYGSMAPKTLIPKIEFIPKRISDQSEIKVRVMSTYDEYDESWNPASVTIPIEEAKLNIDGQTYTSNKDGIINIGSLEVGEYQYSLEKNREEDVPAILRTTDNLIVKEQKIFEDDQKISNWAKNVVYESYELGLISGYNNAFHPQEKLTRAQAVAILLRIKNISLEDIKQVDFTDVNESNWFYKDVSKAIELGFIKGVNENEFKPNEAISREEFADVINKAYEFEMKNEVSFNDYSNISSNYIDSVNKVASNGLIVGSNDKFHPKMSVTREMAAAIFLRLNNLK